MTFLYAALVIASFAMLMVLGLVFFAVRLRSLLRAHLYHRAFSFFAVLAVAGILLACILSFTTHGTTNIAALSGNLTIGN